jgi:hypothetical protein
MSNEIGFAEEVEADEMAEERAAIDAIKALWGIKEGRKSFEKEEAKARVVIDNWFRSHPGETRLSDDERGYVAMLRPGGKQYTYEAPSILWQRAGPLFERMVLLNLFTVDAAKVKTALADGLLNEGDIAPWRTEGIKTPALIVERVERE